MNLSERIIKLKHLITCMKCEVSGKVCDENCPTQYAAGNLGEIIENLEAISEILEQQSTVKYGYWIDADGDNAICGRCNRLNHLYGAYCKHCGAMMIEREISE